MYSDEWLAKLAKTFDNVIDCDKMEKFAQDELIRYYKVLRYHVTRMLYPTDIAYDTRFPDNRFARPTYDAEAMIHISIKDIDTWIQYLKEVNEMRKEYTAQLHDIIINPEKETIKDV
jgi:hypothetical protein